MIHHAVRSILIATRNTETSTEGIFNCWIPSKRYPGSSLGAELSYSSRKCSHDLITRLLEPGAHALLTASFSMRKFINKDERILATMRPEAQHAKRRVGTWDLHSSYSGKGNVVIQRSRQTESVHTDHGATGRDSSRIKQVRRT